MSTSPHVRQECLTHLNPSPHVRQACLTHRLPILRGFTLIEMLTTVAALIIVLGLVVSLARDVRNRSADRLTNDLLGKLDQLMTQYVARNHQLPQVFAFVESRAVESDKLPRRALRNNAELVRALKSQQDLAADFRDFSIAIYDDVAVRDAWGSPIVFMPHGHPQIGMATGDRFFFYSAGPDRDYLTRADNLYSYETSKQLEIPTTSPATQAGSEGTPEEADRLRTQR